jgi:phospholipid transport system transporter-binding protein
MNAALKKAGEGRLSLSGELNFESVSSLRSGLRPFLRDAPDGSLCINLKKVGHCNSAGLALLLQWIDDASAAGVQLTFRQLPVAMTELADLYNLTEIIPLSSMA